MTVAQTLNPMNEMEQLAQEIQERYLRYLKTTFDFKDPALRKSFEDALDSGGLAQGPFPEPKRTFQQGEFPNTLFKELLGGPLEQGFLGAVEGERPLYRHQEEAIRRVFNGRNVVVATGTGSGKTESFIYPILLSLYQELKAGNTEPGVRALVLYPMNALANDQRARLGEIGRKLEQGESPFRLTFGQYTGETPDDKNDSRRRARARIDERLPGEMVLRAEMRETPPHILLTNYSMLEYLLLRPDDSPLFDDGRARWWTFLVLDEAHQYRGAKGIEMAMLLRRLKQRLRQGGREGEFRCIATSATLARGESDKPAIAKFASDLFGEPFNGEDVILGEFEENSEAGPARFHFFLRVLEGAFISLRPEKKIHLDRRAPSGALFEVALCRECGQHYLVGQIRNDKLVEAVRDPGREDFGATFFLPLENDGSGDPSGDENNNVENYTLCARCAEIRPSPQKLSCGHDDAYIPMAEIQGAEERADQIPRCVVCGYQGPDPVREVVHGTDGPHAVIATTLHQKLPEDRRKVLAFADSRQEAAFFAWYLADSYKDILSRNVIRRVAETFCEPVSLATIADKAFHHYREFFQEKVSDDEPTTRKNIWRNLYREFLTHERRISLEGVGIVRWFVDWPDWFNVPDCLAGHPWSLSKTEIRDLMHILLDTMRMGAAVEIHVPNPVSLNWGELGLQRQQTRFRIGSPHNQHDVTSWDGKQGKRVRLLAKLLRRMQPQFNDQEAVSLAEKAARTVWEQLRQCDQCAPNSNDRLLLTVQDERRLNPDWWRLRFIADGDPIYQCDTCRRLQTISVRDVCPIHRCPGSLKTTRRRELNPNHYRSLYQSDLPNKLRVEEHTAQLDKEKAREYQRDFHEGRIHVLSCSTTFELGVDLGDLDTVFLRNVPPEPFNYVQRVGRAGRRGGHPGFAITYCARKSHDLYHFNDPERMIRGEAKPPILTLSNEKIISRHVVALALSLFFRQFTERFKNVEDLFKDLAAPRAVADFVEYLRSNRTQIEDAIRRVLPEGMADKLGLTDGSWIDGIAGKDSRFALVEDEISSDFKIVRDIETKASDRRDYRKAGWAKNRTKTIAAEDVLSFLSRKAVIPKYGFPVDVVELDTQSISKEPSEVSLQRDLSIAISEFAPTSKLVANKKEWTSHGLKKVAERAWPGKHYARCLKHNVFEQWDDEAPAPNNLQCGCKVNGLTYVIPQFGFVTERGTPKEPTRRPSKVFSTRPYFVGTETDPIEIQLPAASPFVTLRKACPGKMVVLCEGRRGSLFYLCDDCGATFGNYEQPPHKTAQGQECSGMLRNVALGHEFVTDVLQARFHQKTTSMIDNVSFGLSLAYALVEGAAEVLEVPSTDLNTTVHYGADMSVPPIVFYDNVPGGAGLVTRLEDEKVFMECLRTAKDRVDGRCGCGEKQSCYGCLRSYRNQFVHDRLQRGPVLDYLGAFKEFIQD